MTDTSDAQLQLKKRARRRLVGAVAFAGLAAVVLPMVMDEEPKVPAQDVQIRIPSLDQPAFEPGKLAATPATKAAPVARPPQLDEPRQSPAAAPVVPATPAEIARPAVGDKVPAKAVEKPADKPATKTEAPAEKAVSRPPAKEVAKEPTKESGKDAAKDAAKPGARAADKPTEKQTGKPADDARRAAAILGDKSAPASAPVAAATAHVILIGAFANPANVKQLQSKLGEISVKTYTEPLESPQGLKTRLRAGPFNSRDAAEKALERMKRIGVNGVVAAKQ